MDRTYDYLPAENVETIRDNLRSKAIARSEAESSGETQTRKKITEISNCLEKHELIIQEFFILLKLYNNNTCESQDIWMGFSTEYDGDIGEALHNLLKRELISEKHVLEQSKYSYCSLTERGKEQVRSIVDYIGPYVSFECDECGSDFPITVSKATWILRDKELDRDQNVRCDVCKYYE